MKSIYEKILLYKWLFLSAIFLLPFSGVASFKEIPAEQWTISTNGNTNYFYSYCAKELQLLLEYRIRKKLPVSRGKLQRNTAPVILLDRCDPTLGRESFRIARENNVIRITGGTPLGMLFGVYEFLQKYCDVWNVAPGVIYAPAGKALAFGDVKAQLTPAFPYRVVYHRGWDFTNPETQKKWDAFDLRNRVTINGRSRFHIFLDPLYQPSRTVGNCHNFYRYVPPKKYGKTHPEYFSMDKTGKRVMLENAGGQLCLSHPDVEKIVYNHLLESIAKDRKRLGVRAPRLYDFSQLDNAYFICCCPNCKKIIAKYGNVDSGLMVYFINKIARRIKKKYPDILLRTFAYVNTEALPSGIRVEDNVMIQFCDLYSQCNHTLPLTHPINKKRRELIEKWGAISKNLMIWDYILQNGDLPVVPVDAIFPDAKFFRKSNVKSIFMESEIRNDNPSAFEYLKNFLLAQAYFNPDQSLEKLLDVYCKGYFGAAHKEMRAYLDLLRKAQKEKPTADPRSWHTRALVHMDLDLLKRCEALVEKAASVNKDPQVALRILWERNVIRNGIARELLARPEKEMERRALLKQLLADRIKVLKDRGLTPRHYNAAEKKLRLPIEESLLTFTDIPEELKKLPPGSIRFLGVTRQQASGSHNKKYHGQFTTDPDSKLSRVMVWIHPDPAKYTKTIGCGTYDHRFKTICNGKITAPGDEKFHWYKAVRFTMGPASYFWALDWQIRFRFDNFFILADGVKEEENPNVYDVWVSVKFQGPAYCKGSQKPNRIFFERCMLVPVAKLNALNKSK